MIKSSRYLLFISLMFGVLVNFSNPTIPIYLDSLDISDAFIGWFLASASLGLLLMAPLWGALGDILDRNKVLAFTFLGFSIGQILFGVFEDPYLLLFAALISGFSVAGVLVNIYSYINDNYNDEQERNKMLSYTVSLYLVGGAFTYLIGGFVAQFVPELRYVFYLQGGLVFLFFLYIYFEKTDLLDVDHHLTRSNFIKQTKLILTLPWVPIYTITLTFFISFSHQNVRRYLDFYISDNGYSTVELGIFVFIVGIVSLFANLFIAPYFLKRYHNFRILQFQFLIAIVFLYFTFQTSNLMTGLYSYYLIYTVMLAIYEPTAISFMSDNKTVPQGVLVGVRQSSVGLGTTIGFIVGGYLYGIDKLYVFYLAVIFYIIVFIGFTILVLIKNKEVKSYHQNYLQEEKNDWNNSW